MDKAKNVRLVEVAVDDIDANELSVNEEDSATFARLKVELETSGMVELPVIARNDDGKFRVLAGHHRIAAWKELGHTTTQALEYDGAFATREEEFNFVQNLNLVRGIVGKGNVIRRVRELRLDPTKLDLFKFPSVRLFPSFQPDALGKRTMDADRRARIHELTLRLAGELAKTIYDERDEVTSVVVANDHLLAVFRVPSGTPGKEARALAGSLRPALAQFLADMIDQQPSVTGSEEWVPLSSIVGSPRVPEAASAVIQKAVDTMVGRDEVSDKAKWQVLEFLCADYLAGVGGDDGGQETNETEEEAPVEVDRQPEVDVPGVAEGGEHDRSELRSDRGQLLEHQESAQVRRGLPSRD